MDLNNRLNSRVTAIEQKTSGPPTPAALTVNWAIWKQRGSYSLKEFAAILAKADPTEENEPPEKAAFLRLMSEAAMKSELRVSRKQYADSNMQPDLWPEYFDVQKADAVPWAEAKGFDITHIK